GPENRTPVQNDSRIATGHLYKLAGPRGPPSRCLSKPWQSRGSESVEMACRIKQRASELIEGCRPLRRVSDDRSSQLTSAVPRVLSRCFPGDQVLRVWDDR